MWYNYSVKRLALISTAILLSLAIGGGISANAAAETVYPQNSDFVFSLSFSDLKDYAVSDGALAFVDGNTVKVYETEKPGDSAKSAYKNGSLTEYSGFDVTISSIDFQNGEFYYADGNGTVYSLSDKAEAEGISIAPPQDTLLCKDNGFMYALLDGRIRIIDPKAENSEDMAVEIEGDFSVLKQYGTHVYAINGNRLCKFTDAEMEITEMQYVDFSPSKTISVGNAQQALKDYTLKFVTVAQDSFMTEINLSAPLTGYFDAGETQQTTEDASALLLGYTGNAAIISIGKKSYITLKTNVTENGDGSEYFTQAEFTKAQLLGDAIYASPFVMECVYAIYPATGAIVKVTGKLHNDVLESDFYQVEYTYLNNGQDVTVKGYVIGGLLTGDNVNDNARPEEKPDENYSEKNNIQTVLLVLMVVILVLIAISYLTWICLSDKRLKRKNKKQDGDK